MEEEVKKGKQTGKIVTIVILSLLVLGLTCYIAYDKVYLGKCGDIVGDEESNNSVIVEDNDEENPIDDTKSTDTGASTTKYYLSNDDRYMLILTNIERNKSNPKMDDGADQSFMFNSDDYYSSQNMMGTYIIQNNKIILSISSGCIASDGSFNCSLPEGVQVMYTNGGSILIELDYIENKIMLGNVELNLR